MSNPKIGTVRHVIVNKQSADQFYWVTWEQFDWLGQLEPNYGWIAKASKFETYEEARAFSLSL